MRKFDTAHRAAVAVAGKNWSRVTDCLAYADRLIRQRVIRPHTNGNGQIKYWFVIEAGDWWLVSLAEKRVESGPFQTKSEALAATGMATSKKKSRGVYVAAGKAIVQTPSLDKAGIPY
jgi:hypothetical protein